MNETLKQRAQAMAREIHGGATFSAIVATLIDFHRAEIERVPEKQIEGTDFSDYARRYIDGWNACLAHLKAGVEGEKAQ